jgi:hypothetical protein
LPPVRVPVAREKRHLEVLDAVGKNLVLGIGVPDVVRQDVEHDLRPIVDILPRLARGPGGELLFTGAVDAESTKSWGFARPNRRATRKPPSWRVRVWTAR